MSYVAVCFFPILFDLGYAPAVAPKRNTIGVEPKDTPKANSMSPLRSKAHLKHADWYHSTLMSDSNRPSKMSRVLKTENEQQAKTVAIGQRSLLNAKHLQ